MQYHMTCKSHKRADRYAGFTDHHIRRLLARLKRRRQTAARHKRLRSCQRSVLLLKNVRPEEPVRALRVTLFEAPDGQPVTFQSERLRRGIFVGRNTRLSDQCLSGVTE